MTTDPTRAKFEEWAKKHFGYDPDTYNPYDYGQSRLAWEAYKAAWQACEASREQPANDQPDESRAEKQLGQDIYDEIFDAWLTKLVGDQSVQAHCQRLADKIMRHVMGHLTSTKREPPPLDESIEEEIKAILERWYVYDKASGSRFFSISDAMEDLRPYLRSTMREYVAQKALTEDEKTELAKARSTLLEEVPAHLKTKQ